MTGNGRRCKEQRSLVAALRRRKEWAEVGAAVTKDGRGHLLPRRAGPNEVFGGAWARCRGEKIWRWRVEGLVRPSSDVRAF